MTVGHTYTEMFIWDPFSHSVTVPCGWRKTVLEHICVVVWRKKYKFKIEMKRIIVFVIEYREIEQKSTIAEVFWNYELVRSSDFIPHFHWFAKYFHLFSNIERYTDFWKPICTKMNLNRVHLHSARSHNYYSV